MTKEQLKADNERLGAEVAALRELLTVIGNAELPRHAPGHDSDRNRQAADRLRDITAIARGLMRYAGSPVFPRVVFTTTETLREINAGPLWYRAAEGALPATCNSIAPVTGRECNETGPHSKHRSGMVVWEDEPEQMHPHCEHCSSDCDGTGPGHVVECQTEDCPSVQQLVRAS